MTRAHLMHDPAPDCALVSLVRPSVFGGAIPFSIWAGDKLVGIMTAGSIMQHKAEPGHHVFMAHGKNWSYVLAVITAGKYYFIASKDSRRLEGPRRPDADLCPRI